MKIQIKTTILALAIAGVTLAAKPAKAGLNATNGLSTVNGLNATNGLNQLNGLWYVNGRTVAPQAIVGIWAASGIDPTSSLAQALAVRSSK